MRSIDISDRVTPLDMYPYDDYRVLLRSVAHLHYSYCIKKDRIEVELSDYLKEAPDAVIRDTCRSIVKWSNGYKYAAPKSLGEYIRSPEFIVGNRPTYLKRSRSFSMTQQGKEKNLIDSVERLMDAGLVGESDIENSYYTWANHMAKYRFGQCNQTFRVVSVNPILDDQRVPDQILDYVIYHETLHLRQDTSKNRRPHNAQFRSWEHMFPDYDEAEKYLRGIYSTLRVNPKHKGDRIRPSSES